MPLTNSTFQDLLTLALKNAGVVGQGQTAGAEDMNDACAMMNDMFAQWQQRRYLVYHLVEKTLTCNGAASYSIGPGGDISVIQRPAMINAAFARQTVVSTPNQIDYPIKVITSRETYSRIALKSLQSFPEWLWYDAAVPLGLIYPYPVISSQFELHVVFREQLQTAVNLTDTIVLPPEYREPIIYNLAVRLSAAYGTPLNPVCPALAKAGMETIRVANAQIPTMSMPFGVGRRRGIWNIFSDGH